MPIADFWVPRYLKRFQCLGGECEDTCCQGWKVYVDKTHYERLQRRMSSPAEKRQFNERFARVEPATRTDRHALIVFQENGHCSFLDEKKLCSLHRRYGADDIPDICYTYPRILGGIGTSIEVVAAVSCPEVARLLLLADDGAELVPGEVADLGRGTIGQAVESPSSDPYVSHFRAVRTAAVGLLEDDEHPIAARLYFLAVFAERSRAWLRRGAFLDEPALQAIMRSLESGEARARLAAELADAGAGVDRRVAFDLVARALELALPGTPARLDPIIRVVQAAFVSMGAPLDGDAGAIRDAHDALPPLSDELAARLDTIVARYAAHDLLRTWYVKEDSFLIHVHLLLVRIALLRFLIGARARMATGVDVPRLDALAIHVIYGMSRVFEHVDEYTAALRGEIEQRGATLANAMALTRV